MSPGEGSVSGMRPAAPVPGSGEVLDALAARPGGPELLRLGRGREDLELALVGGAVRDLLLARAPRELDVVLAGDAALLARELASLLAGSARTHERFGTAAVEWGAGRIDIAERRAESYPAPGALPRVRPGTIEQDLRRRDFTVNAIAVPLGGPASGELLSAEHGLEDLAAGRLRVLHERSFIDDPTRLLRLARYRARLGFDLEQRTAELAAAALGAHALATVSRGRIGAELRLALSEADAVATLGAMSELGVLSALDRSLCLQERLARAALALLPDDGRPEELLLASLLLAPAANANADRERAMFELLDGLEFTAGERERVMRTALEAGSLPGAIELAGRPSQLHEALSGHTLEAVALAGALGGERSQDGAAAAAREWLGSLRHVRLAITGDDLLAEGIPAGPQIGRRLDRALARKLDGELAPGPEAELRAALEAGI